MLKLSWLQLFHKTSSQTPRTPRSVESEVYSSAPHFVGETTKMSCKTQRSRSILLPWRGTLEPPGSDGRFAKESRSSWAPERWAPAKWCTCGRVSKAQPVVFVSEKSRHNRNARVLFLWCGVTVRLILQVLSDTCQLSTCFLALSRAEFRFPSRTRKWMDTYAMIVRQNAGYTCWWYSRWQNMVTIQCVARARSARATFQQKIPRFRWCAGSAWIRQNIFQRKEPSWIWCRHSYGKIEQFKKLRNEKNVKKVSDKRSHISDIKFLFPLKHDLPGQLST